MQPRRVGSQRGFDSLSGASQRVGLRRAATEGLSVGELNPDEDRAGLFGHRLRGFESRSLRMIGQGLSRDRKLQAMDAVNIHIGPLVFDRADYDAEGDVLYLHRGEPIVAEGEETREGHMLRFEPGTQRIVGLTVINARWLLDREGRLVVTVPETVEASADELAPALASA
jgi:hypothetical protein